MNYLSFLYIYLIPQAPGWLLLDFGDWFHPYVIDVRDIIPCIRVTRGALCGKEKTSQLGGALLQDQHLFFVVRHSIYINAKGSLFSNIWCYDFMFFNAMLIYWIKWLDNAT